MLGWDVPRQEGETAPSRQELACQQPSQRAGWHRIGSGGHRSDRSAGSEPFRCACFTECLAGGVHGFIVVDLPPEEGSGLLDACKASGLALVPLVAPTTTPARLDAIAKNAGGYVYCVSVTGVTGARAELPADLAEFVARVKAAIPLPAVVGFGLSTRAHVASVGAVAEGAVMGSAIVRAAAAGGADAVSALIKEVTGRSD